MTNRNKLILAALAFCLAFPFVSGGKETLIYNIFFADNKVGLEKYSEEVTGEGMIKTEIESEITFNRGSSIIWMMKKGVFLESPVYIPIEFYYSDTTNEQVEEFKGRIENGNIIVNNRSKEVEYPIPGKILFYRGLRELVKQSIEKGQNEFSYSFFSTDQKKVIEVDNSILEKKDGIAYIKSTFKTIQGIEVFEKKDFNGYLLEQEIPALSFKKKLAANPDDSTELKKNLRFDIRRMNFVAVENGNLLGQDVETARYKIESEGMIDIPENVMQKIIYQGQKETILLISKIEPKGNSAFSLESTVDQCDYLKNNDFLNIEDEKVLQVIKELKRESKELAGFLVKVHNWILENIRMQSLEFNFLPASEIIKKKNGDCSEYAVLFSALLRAGGIPSKLCFGLKYMNGFFRFHFWNEYFDGTWIPFDSTLIPGGISAIYIKLMDTSLNGLSVMELGILLAKYLRIKRITVLEVDRGK